MAVADQTYVPNVVAVVGFHSDYSQLDGGMEGSL